MEIYPVCCICLTPIDKEKPISDKGFFHSDCYDKWNAFPFRQAAEIFFPYLLGIEVSQFWLYIFAWPKPDSERDSLALAKIAQLEALLEKAGIKHRKLTRKTTLGQVVDCLGIPVSENFRFKG